MSGRLKRCKHERGRYIVATVYVEQTEERTPLVIGQCRCNACGAVIPLGPSNDEPEAVRVEMRAAEIAQDIACMGWTVLRRDSLVFAGWHDEQLTPLYHSNGFQYYEPPKFDESQWHAGYLARAIATHDEEGT